MYKSIFILIAIAFTQIGVSQTQNFWTKKSNFTGLKRERAVAFSINDKGYIATGVDTADLVKNDLWEYDPTLDVWTQKANIIGDGRRNAVGFSINGKGYLGTGMNHDEAALGTVLSDFMSYDPTNNTWTSKANFPGSTATGVYFATGFSLNAKGYICGGKRGPNDYTAEMWEYSPSTDTWIQRLDFPGGVRYQLCSFTVDNLAYVGLGVDQDVYRKDIWAYSPLTNEWTEKNDFLGGERGGVSTFTLGQRGFICLGNDGGVKDDLWEYNPFEDAWTSRANFDGSKRKNAVAFVIGDSAFVGTGKGISGKKSSMYVYNPVSVLSLYKNTTVDLTIYPNPTSDYLMIKTKDNNNIQFQIFNLQGDLLLTNQLNNGIQKIDLINLAKGTYIIHVFNRLNESNTSQQFIIQ